MKKYILLVFIILLSCGVMGCDNVEYKKEVPKISYVYEKDYYGDYGIFGNPHRGENLIRISFTGEDGDVWIHVSELKMLSEYTCQKLVRCGECKEVFDKDNTIQEYDNGWICKNCIKKRIEKLGEKIKSLQPKGDKTR